MSQSPSSGQDEQQQLIRSVGKALLGVAPAQWQELRAEYRSAGRHVEVDVTVIGADGASQPVRPPRDIVDLLGQLRSAMYRPGRGTWLSGVYRLEPPARFNADFDPDTEPQWRRTPPPIGFQDELRFFPRDDEYIPDWMRQRAGMREAATTPAQPADPAPTPPSGIARPAPADETSSPASPGAPAETASGAIAPDAGDATREPPAR